MREKVKMEYCVTCPKCGKVVQKTNATDSVVLCPRCSYEYYVYVGEGITVEIEASKDGTEQFFGRIKEFVLSIRNG